MMNAQQKQGINGVQKKENSPVHPGKLTSSTLVANTCSLRFLATGRALGLTA